MPAPQEFLLSLPPAMSKAFEKVFPGTLRPWVVSCDPPGRKLGSGGGVAQLLANAWSAQDLPFEDWLSAAQRLVLLAGGQSRRLPAYAPCGKVLMPVPVMRWSYGQRMDQTLLDLQADDYARVLSQAPGALRILVASGDVFLKFPSVLPTVPPADLVGFGMSVSPEVASHFGVFFSPRESPGKVAFFLQKPPPEKIRSLAATHTYFVDTGLWLMSREAVGVLMARCGWTGRGFSGGSASSYELYAGLGPSLGASPEVPNPEISGLSVAVVPLPDAEFHHFGTTRQMIESLSALQNLPTGKAPEDGLWRKPHPDMYVLNSRFAFRARSPKHRMLWIENCSLPPDFLPAQDNALTGLPEGDWAFPLNAGECLDCVPIGPTGFAIRPYGFDDPFSGPVREAVWIGRPATSWFEARGISLPEAGISPDCDIQEAPLFAVVEEPGSDWIAWLLACSPQPDPGNVRRWISSRRLSARELGDEVNLERLFRQRRAHAAHAASSLWEHRASNPFFRMDLANTAAIYAAGPAPAPDPAAAAGNALDRMHELAFSGAVLRARGRDGDAQEKAAFSALAEKVIGLCPPVAPRSTLIEDQILWARSPIRLDLAGGWSDTPPFCLKHGGAVVNLGVDLNGQAPIQVFVRVSPERQIVIKSIDLGAQTTIRSFADLDGFSDVRAEFSLAKAAFCLAGFHPRFHLDSPGTLPDLLDGFGGGLEVSLLAATPKGSGLGTSSILSATLLAALGSAGGLGWDREEIFRRTMALEQMLTSGGGWQDQAGGIYHGIKLIETGPGLDQKPTVRWLPERLLGPQSANRTALLYYTGMTRVAKTILQEIVRGMLLNSRSHMDCLFAIREHAVAAYQSIQRESWTRLCDVVRTSWELNQALDPGTAPPEIRSILASVSDWTAAAKLLGAGGGGYMLLLAKDEAAGALIREHLRVHPPNPRARFVDFSLSPSGLVITRS